MWSCRICRVIKKKSFCGVVNCHFFITPALLEMGSSDVAFSALVQVIFVGLETSPVNSYLPGQLGEASRFCCCSKFLVWKYCICLLIAYSPVIYLFNILGVQEIRKRFKMLQKYPSVEMKHASSDELMWNFPQDSKILFCSYSVSLSLFVMAKKILDTVPEKPMVDIKEKRPGACFFLVHWCSNISPVGRSLEWHPCLYRNATNLILQHKTDWK